MMRNRVNYDRIAPDYDRRFKQSHRSGTTEALAALARQQRPERVLEVGCGTGHWLSELKPLAGRVIGLDPSAGMLEKARGRDRDLLLLRGRAEQLPFREPAFDLILCVHAIHHFDDWRRFIEEAWRGLRPGGVLAVVGMDPHARRDRWYVYDYFEGVREADLRRFPAWGEVFSQLAVQGAERMDWRIVERIRHTRHGRAILEDPFLSRFSSSQLALLSDQAYEAGVRRIEEAVQRAEAAGETLVFHADLQWGMLTGHKNG